MSRRRGRTWAISAGLAVAAVAWLALTATRPVGDTRLLFGRWHALPFAAAMALFYAAGLVAAAAGPRKLMFGTWLATILLGFLWLLLEGAGAVGLVNYPRAFGLERTKVLGEEAVPNLDVSGTTVPDITAARGVPSPPVPFRYKTDRRGYRNEIDREAGDIYLVGDSFIVAALVPWEKTLAPRLEAALGKAVVNVALIQTGPQVQRRMLTESKLPLAGRVVVHFVYEGNDLQDSAAFRQDRAPGPRPRRSLAGRSFARSLVCRLQRLTQPRIAQADLEKGSIGGVEYYFYLKPFERYAGEVPVVLEELAAFRREVESAGGRYVVVFLPDKLRTLGPVCTYPPDTAIKDLPSLMSPLREPLLEWAKETGVPLLDLTDPMQAAARAGRIPFFPLDSHPNEEGYAVMAEELARWEALRR